MRFLLLLGFAGSIVVACGGSSTSNLGNGNGSDAGASGDGGGFTSAGCPLPQPDLGCAGCYGGTTSPECVQGKWVCVALPCAPPPPDAGPDSTSPADASVDGTSPSDASVDGSSSSDGSTADGANGCAACDPQTQYCEISYGPPQSDAGPSYFCLAFAGCDAGPACSCAPAGPFCTCDDASGQITVTCPFHP